MINLPHAFSDYLEILKQNSEFYYFIVIYLIFIIIILLVFNCDESRLSLLLLRPDYLSLFFFYLLQNSLLYYSFSFYRYLIPVKFCCVICERVFKRLVIFVIWLCILKNLKNSEVLFSFVKSVAVRLYF